MEKEGNMVNAVRNLEEIERLKKLYKGEWLLLTDCKIDRKSVPIKGILVAHSKDRNEIYSKLKDYSGNLCIEYSGELPEDYTGAKKFGKFSWLYPFRGYLDRHD